MGAFSTLIKAGGIGVCFGGSLLWGTNITEKTVPSSCIGDASTHLKEGARNMIRVGVEPFLECSSRGDRRFSAFYAKVNGRSIEEQYQAAKVFSDGSTGLSWRAAKGRQATNMREVSRLYKALWRQYLMKNPELLEVLKSASGLSDVFGQTGSNCQALTLWELRSALPFKGVINE